MQVAVYRNRNSRCCIALTEDKGHVQFIGLEEGGGEMSIDIHKMDARTFHSEYKELETYPVGRAIEHYTTPLTAAIRMTERAAKALHKLSTDKGIAMNDQARRTLSERNVLATHKAGIMKSGPCPAVAPCETTELVPGSSKKTKKGTWDVKETPTESNREASVRAVRNHQKATTKAAKKTARQEQKKRMTEQAQQDTVSNEQEADTAAQKKPASKPAAKKAASTKKPAAKEATKKPAAKEATKSKTTKTTKTADKASKEKTVNDKTTKTAKKTTAKTEPKAKKAATKAPAKKATKTASKANGAAKPTKLTKGTGKKSAAPAKTAKKGAVKKDKGDGGRRGRKGSFDESQKIKVLVKDNPKREGTTSYDTFELLKKSKTVGDFFANGGGSHNLHWNIERGYIEVN